MSGGSASFTDTAIQVRLEPPRSLHGVEDADVIWDTITRRFPNAAPLLCEMETVIERAEDLLRQLKTPCAEESGTSGTLPRHDARHDAKKDLSESTPSGFVFVRIAVSLSLSLKQFFNSLI